MPSYLSYMRQMTVTDADDDNIESWITVRGNHIPIKKGQSKEDAVKSFIEKKGGKEKGGDWESQGRETAKREASHEFKKSSGVGLKFTELGKGDHGSEMGEKKGGSEEKVDNEKIKKAINKVAVAVNERKADEKTSIKNLTKEMGLNNAETQKLNEFFGTGEGKAKYPAEFETVRKNAKANPYLYDLRYTQKSKAKAYEEYKKDTEKPKNTFLSNQNTLKEFANHFGISESVAKAASEKFGDSFYNLMTKDPKAGVGIATNYKDYTKEDVEKHLQKLNKKDTEKKGPTMRISLPEGKERKEIIDRVLKDFHKNYDKLYKDDKLDARGGDLVKKFDKDMKESSEFKEFVREVVKQRGDVFSSDREVKALMMAANEYGLVVGSNSEKKDATTKQSDSPLVNAVARSLNMSAENAEKEVNGAVQHIKDLIKAKDLRNGDVEETLQGLGIESDYAEEFMEWVSAPTKKKASTSKKKKEPAIVREGGVNWVDEKAWNDPRSDPWYALYE